MLASSAKAGKPRSTRSLSGSPVELPALQQDEARAARRVRDRLTSALEAETARYEQHLEEFEGVFYRGMAIASKAKAGRWGVQGPG